MEEKNGKDDGEAIDDQPRRSVVPDSPPVPEPPLSDRLLSNRSPVDSHSMPPPQGEFHYDSASLLEPPLGDRLPSHQSPADVPSMRPPPAAFHDRSASLPVVLETERKGEGGSAALDDQPSRSEADGLLPVPEPRLGDRLPSHQSPADSPSISPLPAAIHDHSSTPGGKGEGESAAVYDRPSRSEANGPVVVPALAGNHLPSHHPGADRPPLHPAPAALHDRSESIPKALDDHAIPNGTAGSGIRNSPAGHRRTQSEVVLRGPKRTNSFQNFKSQIQRAWKWGGSPKEKSRNFSFNPEVLANQKRQWYQLQSKSLDRTKYKEPTELFEHLIVTGLPPHANVEAVEQAFARKKKWELAMATAVLVDGKHAYWFPSPPSLEPQMLFKYPPGRSLPMSSKDLCAFCFPGGVKARMVERTPSLSDLNELVYGQGHLGRDDTAFIFSLKVADNASLYGVCLLVPEIVQRSPGILGGSSPFCRPAASRFLVSAPRCYCLLTRVPFFELHFEMLNSIVTQERLDRITQFVSEVSVTDHTPPLMRSPDHFNDVPDSPFRVSCTDWMSSAIPVDSAVRLSACAAGIITGDEVASSIKCEETQSLPSTASRFARSHENLESGLSSPGSLLPSHSSSTKIGRSSSSISLFSSARILEEEDDPYFSNSESEISGELMTMEKESKNEFIKMVQGYSSLPVPARGSEIVFHPLEHLHTIQYRRPAVSDLGLEADLLALEFQDPSALAEASAKLAAAEEAAALSIWTIATLCRAVSLDNILALITGVLLEKQVVVTCPNLGVLSAIVLSLIPIIQPFEWQSLLLPRSCWIFLMHLFHFLWAYNRNLLTLCSKLIILFISTCSKTSGRCVTYPCFPSVTCFLKNFAVSMLDLFVKTQ